MPPPAIWPDVRPLFVARRYIHLLISEGISIKLGHRYLSREWAVLKRFSGSEVKGQRSKVKVKVQISECYDGGGIHFDGVASSLTRLIV